MAQELERKKTSEEVQWENRIAYQKAEHDRVVKAKDAIQAEIDKKTADYAIHISQRDADSKKMRTDVLAASEQLKKDKAEFQAILVQFQKDKLEFAKVREGIDNEKSKVEANANNVREFVIAVQRACSLIGL